MKKIIIIFVGLLISASCSNYLDINKDPNSYGSEDISAENMIRGAMLGNQFWQTSSAARVSMIWMNQGTGSANQYTSINNWNAVTASEFDNSWGNSYRNSLYHSKLAYEKAIEEGKYNLAAVAQIIHAHALGSVISLWGDVPYSEAFNDEMYPNPKFDSQVDLYVEVQNILDNAINILESDYSDSILNDIYYNGVKSEWLKLAHALKARYFLHVKDYQNALVQAQQSFTSISDDYVAQFSTQDGTNNPFAAFEQVRQGYLTADDAYAWHLLKYSNSNPDPRYRGNSKTNEFLRFNYIYTSSQNLNKGGIGKFGEANQLPLVTYGEMLLIIAESKARLEGLSEGVNAYNDYRALLKQGYTIGVNNDCLGNPSACAGKYDFYLDEDFESGGIENEDGVEPVHALLREIYEERYVIFIGNFESFTDFRRTNNIAEIQLKEGISGTPQRFIYAQSEINGNTNVPSPLPDVTEKTPVHQ